MYLQIKQKIVTRLRSLFVTSNRPKSAWSSNEVTAVGAAVGVAAVGVAAVGVAAVGVAAVGVSVFANLTFTHC